MNPAQKQKLLAIEQRLDEHPFPPQLVVENTSACNMQCIHCSHKELERPKKHMRRELWDRIVEEVGRESPDTELWPTFYGEALVLGNELWDRLDYAHAAGCRNLVLNSNGTLLSHRNQYDRILSSPLKRFILSLDGYSKETFEKIRYLGKWDKVYPQVEELLRRKARSGQTYPAIICQFSKMRENAHEVEDFRRHWQALGAEVKVRPMLEWTASGTVRSDFVDHGVDFRIACPWANNTMAIHQDGRVVTCAVDWSGRFTVGNVNEISVKEAWQRLGEQLRRVHREHRWQDMPAICQGCGDWQVAGADYESEQVAGTRPFWFREDMAAVAKDGTSGG